MSWFLLVLNVALVNIVLSGDNALAISMAASRLPAPMRKKAIVFGSTIAIVLLILFTAAGTFIIRLPILKGVAGLLLLAIAIRMVVEHMHPAAATTAPDHQPRQLRKAISTIVLADLGMEMDNAMAMLGAANGELSVLMVGFLCTIPFLILGSGIISKVFDKIPWIIYVAAAYIAWLAGKMIGDDPIFGHVPWQTLLDWVLPGLCVVLFALAVLFFRHRMRRTSQGASSETSVSL